MTETSTTRCQAGDVLAAAVEFGSAEGAIAAARDFTVEFLARSATSSRPCPPGAADAARLVVSELVTNVVKYAPGPCRLELALHADTLEIRVHDSHPVMPVARPRDPGRLGQHGMEIVLAVCTGVEVEATSHGKRVRARVPLF
ncbi:ATP-binding protein [Streptomyces sp. ISL-36]|uniref:ATP-binding protein n=1 Tax=Streptomyces sp. ISL-36 TaxID=2819182 RepID=UPI001BE69895|nr:ATP-binding protein [Streptomyces sp. ISL-36]MBT2440344.1 ATP-binding protein [Streptomyces sp. ISL-36]